MPKPAASIASELREFMDRNQKNAVTFPLDEFYTFVDRSTIRETFYTELYDAFFDEQLIFQRGASCFIVVRDYNFSRDDKAKFSAAKGKRSASECAEMARDFLDKSDQSNKVVSMRWKPDLYEFVGRSVWRDVFTVELQKACRASEMQFLVGSACGFFVWDYNFSPVRGQLY
jgi:hypothetical protein